MSFLSFESSVSVWVETNRSRNEPERDDNKLRVFSPFFDVMCNDGNVSEVKGGINFVHEVQGRRL